MMVHTLLSLIFFFVIFVQVIFGSEQYGRDEYIRRKRSVSCSSSNSLKKYNYVYGHTACISPSASVHLGTAGVTDDDAIEIVNTHNNYRSKETATDMTKMSWDSEISYIAQRWAENCDFNHDSGYRRRIPGRFSVGQNLAQSGNKMTWMAVIKLWHDEIADFTYNGVNVLSKVGHYTQVVWAKSIKIGCGYADCGNKIGHHYVCNYGPAGNFDINKPFTKGKTCGTCPGHCINSLCDCNIVCLNGGTLNLQTCTCSCIIGYVGPDCALDCSTVKDPYYCASQYTPAKCSAYTNVPSECPHMCQFCPNAGIAVTGKTNGRGTLLIFDSTSDGQRYAGNNNLFTLLLLLIFCIFNYH